MLLIVRNEERSSFAVISSYQPGQKYFPTSSNLNIR